MIHLSMASMAASSATTVGMPCLAASAAVWAPMQIPVRPEKSISPREDTKPFTVEALVKVTRSSPPERARARRASAWALS